MMAVFLHPGSQLPDVHAFIPLFAHMVHKKTLAQGGGKGIHHEDLPVGVGFPQLFGGNESAVTLPSTLKKIGYGAFANSKKLTTFTVENK